MVDEFRQVLRLLRRQRLNECDQCDLVLNPIPHWQPVQVGEYRSNVIVLVTTLASVFCRRCSLSMFADEVPYSTALQ